MSARAPEAALFDLMRGALATRALGIAADLRIADRLAAGARPVSELAGETGADPDTLRRILRALASDGVFAEEDPCVFANTPVSEALRQDAFRDFAHLFGDTWHRAAGGLGPSGEPSFPLLFGADFWAWLADNPEERATFDRAMVESRERRVERLEKVDWRGDELVVDVGGGNGSLLVELLGRRPGLRGIVFDLPETTRDETAFGDRLEFVPGDFFERVPPGDVYVLGTILHDWGDERAAAILRTVRAAAGPSARLLVIDAVVPPGNDPHGAKWLDLLMLALFGGRERDEAQWRELLRATGWEIDQLEDGLIQCRSL